MSSTGDESGTPESRVQASDVTRCAELRRALESIETLAASRKSGAMGQILAIATHALHGAPETIDR